MAASARLEPGAFGRFDLRLVLLVGQSLSFGIYLALLIITASALFLTRFGSQALPYTYITVAILGSLLFYGYAGLQRRFSLPTLSVATICAIALFFLLTWLGLTLTGAGWITFSLMVSYALILQMGFVLLGNQAGRLFDVREMKGKFPRVVAGFAIGFLTGGLLASLLTNVIDRVENLLLLAMVSSLSMLAFLLVTNRRYHAKLIQAGSVRRPQPSKPLWHMLAKRFVLLIVIYQMLSAMVTRLIGFMVFDQVAARYTDSLGLAQFMGNYTVALNVTDILFLALFAGLLLSRFGLNYGLSANPVVAGVFLVATIGVGLAVGIDSGLFFFLIVSARIADLAMTDGATRSSINTAYQALPAHERATVQTGVEGIGVPIALGLTGVILLLFGAIGALSILRIAVFTLIVTVIWTASALLVYRGYASSLVQTMRRRALDPAELTLDDGPSLEIVKSFVHSDKIREVRLALDILEDTGHDSLDANLIALVGHRDAAVRTEALGRLERNKVTAALPAVEGCLQSETNPLAKAAAVQALCSLKESAAVEQIMPYLDDENRDVRLAAAVGLLRYGGIAGILAAGQSITTLEHSTDPADRQLLARIIGGIESTHFYEPLLRLLYDEDQAVRQAALVAASVVQHPRLLPLIVDNLDQSGTRSAAMTAVVAYGDAILPCVKTVLADYDEDDSSEAIRLVRASGQIKSQSSIDYLKEHIDHPDGEVRTALLGALSTAYYLASPDEIAGIRAALQYEMRVATRILIAGQEIGETAATEPLQRAFADELANVRQRVFFLLSMMYDRRATLRASERLKSGDSGEQAMALETLDVMLPGDLRNMVFPLLDPRLATGQRAQRLGHLFPTPGRSREAWLTEIVTDSDGNWRHPWIRTCAVYAVGKLGLRQMAGDIELALPAASAPLRQTAAWALHTLARERFEAHKDELSADPNPKVARFAAGLADPSD
jgi:HEAT repeat protein